MKITWLGHACFLLEAGGAAVICDPFDPKVGYLVRERKADVVTVSHEHYDHNCTSWVAGSPVVVRGPGEHRIGAVGVTGLMSFHDGQRGGRRGANTVFLIEAGGVRVCHLGDLGHMPDRALLDAIGQPHVLLVPVGGTYTIGAAEAAELTGKIGARLTIPMHFRTDAVDMPIETEAPYARATGALYAGSCSVELDAQYGGPAVVILGYEGAAGGV